MLIFVNNIPVFIKESLIEQRFSQAFDQRISPCSFEQITGKSLVLNASGDFILAYILYLERSKNPNVSKVFFKVSNKKDIKILIKSKFKFIKAAGGVVENFNREILLMKRLGFWDLPKGKADRGEDSLTTAEREVEEECNVLVEVHEKLATTWHTYFAKGQLHIKRTRWYYMTLKSDKGMKPQTEEGIEELRWVKPSELESYEKDTYNSIRYVLSAYKESKLIS